jgi:hypothetical protein
MLRRDRQILVTALVVLLWALAVVFVVIAPLLSDLLGAAWP